LRVRLGELDLTSSEDCTTYNYKKICAPPIEEFTIEKATIHEEFNPFSPWFDVALLKLDRKVVFKGKKSVNLFDNYNTIGFLF